MNFRSKFLFGTKYSMEILQIKETTQHFSYAWMIHFNIQYIFLAEKINIFSFFSRVVLDLKLTCHIGLPCIIIADLLGVIIVAHFCMVSLDKDYSVKVRKITYSFGYKIDH